MSYSQPLTHMDLQMIHNACLKYGWPRDELEESDEMRRIILGSQYSILTRTDTECSYLNTGMCSPENNLYHRERNLLMMLKEKKKKQLTVMRRSICQVN